MKRIVIFYWAIIIALLLTGCSITSRYTDLESGSTKSIVPYPLSFRVETNKIINSNGFESALKGLATIDPVRHALYGDAGSGPWSEAHFQKMKAWGAQIIRLPIHPAVWKKHGDAQTLAVIDQAVQWAQKYQMYVCLDFHSIGFPPNENYKNSIDPYYGPIYVTTKNDIKYFWRLMAQRYKNNDVVAFYEIFNEPVNLNLPNLDTDWPLWKSFAEEVIAEIRAIDPAKVILVGGLDYAYDLSKVATQPVSGSNIAYSVHPYPGSNWAKSWDNAFGQIKNNYPLFVTEFGFDPAGSGTDYAEDKYTGAGLYRDEIIAYLSSKKIGWSAWCFSATWVPALLTDTAYNPSQSGTFFRSKL